MAALAAPSAAGHSISLGKAGLAGDQIGLEKNGMTKRQQDIFKIFEKTVGSLKPKMSQLDKDEILAVIRELPINIADPSDHSDKTMIVTMMIAFEVLEKAHGNSDEFKEAVAAVKAGWYSFAPTDDQPVEAHLYAKTASSPTDEKKEYHVKLGKQTLAQLYKDLEVLPTLGDSVSFEKAFDFDKFQSHLMYLIKNPLGRGAPTSDQTKAHSSLKEHVKALKEFKLGDAVNKALDDLEKAPTLGALKDLGKALEIEDVTDKSTPEETAKALIEAIQAAITKQLNERAAAGSSS